MEPILELKNINYAYHTLEGETKALSDISFSVAPGEFVAIVGPSGCGNAMWQQWKQSLACASKAERFLNGIGDEVSYAIKTCASSPSQTTFSNIILKYSLFSIIESV